MSLATSFVGPFGWSFWFQSGSAPPPTASDIREAIGYALSNLSTVTDIVGQSIFEGRRPQLEPLPTITYGVLGHEKGKTLAGQDGTAVARVRFFFSSRRKSDVVAITKAVFGLFNGYNSGADGDLYSIPIRWVWHMDDVDQDVYPEDGSDNTTFIIQSDYRFDYVFGSPA